MNIAERKTLLLIIRPPGSGTRSAKQAVTVYKALQNTCRNARGLATARARKHDPLYVEYVPYQSQKLFSFNLK